MDPTMKGSAAFLGLKYAYLPRRAYFFGNWPPLAGVHAFAPKKLKRALKQGKKSRPKKK